MTPKEKAKELVGKYYINIPLRDCDNRIPHNLALIAVDEIIETVNMCIPYQNEETYVEYWREVKQEINNL